MLVVERTKPLYLRSYPLGLGLRPDGEGELLNGQFVGERLHRRCPRKRQQRQRDKATHRLPKLRQGQGQLIGVNRKCMSIRSDLPPAEHARVRKGKDVDIDRQGD